MVVAAIHCSVHLALETETMKILTMLALAYFIFEGMKGQWKMTQTSATEPETPGHTSF